jgi:hypothetical protein
MKHQYKSLIFKALDLLPATVGYYLYHRLQDQFSKASFDQKLAANKASLEVIKRILSQRNISVEHKTVVELGSGWVPIMPYLLKYECNARSVSSYDINEHFKPSEIEALNRIFSEKYRLSNNKFTGKYNLAEGIQYFPKTDIRQANLKETDILISRFVLEHVPPELIAAMHHDFAASMKPGSYVLHLISPSDHRAYSDKSLSLYDFLQYSPSEWKKIQTKFDYHNRLRLPQYVTILEKDFEIIYIEFDSCKLGSEQFEKFKKLAIHSDYAAYTDEELTAGSINVLLRKK